MPIFSMRGARREPRIVASRRSHRLREDALEVRARARPGIGLVADVVDRDLDQRRDVGSRHRPPGRVPGQRRRNAELALERRQPVDERLARWPPAERRSRRRRRRAPARPSSPSALWQVEAHHVVDHDAVGEPMVQIGDRRRAHARRSARRPGPSGTRSPPSSRPSACRSAPAGCAARAPRCAAPVRRCARLRARCRRTAGDRPATGTTRRCASARPCRSRR